MLSLSSRQQSAGVVTLRQEVRSISEGSEDASELSGNVFVPEQGMSYCAPLNCLWINIYG